MGELIPVNDAFVGYVPVLSRAYEELFDSLPEGSSCYVLGGEVISQFDNLRKEIRALDPERAAHYLSTAGYFGTVAVAQSIEGLTIIENNIHIPDDEIASYIELQLPDRNITRHAVFLRWNRDNSVMNVEITPDRVVTPDQRQEEIIRVLYEEAGQATNWWRGVGAVLVLGEKVIDVAHNANMPSDYTSAIDGDPRSALRRGMGIEITNDVHAEATLIARAARVGEKTEGGEIFVETFPCPKCAKDIVNAGLVRCYYISGYAVADSEHVMRSAGVEIVQLLTTQELPVSNKVRLVDYPAKA